MQIPQGLLYHTVVAAAFLVPQAIDCTHTTTELVRESRLDTKEAKRFLHCTTRVFAYYRVPGFSSLFFSVELSHRLYLYFLFFTFFSLHSIFLTWYVIDQYINLSGSSGRTVHSRARDWGAKLTYLLLFQGYHHHRHPLPTPLFLNPQ